MTSDVRRTRADVAVGRGRGRTTKQKFRQKYREVCRRIAIDALQAASYSDSGHYREMAANVRHCARLSSELSVLTKEFRDIVAEEKRLKSRAGRPKHG